LAHKREELIEKLKMSFSRIHSSRPDRARAAGIDLWAVAASPLRRAFLFLWRWLRWR